MTKPANGIKEIINSVYDSGAYVQPFNIIKPGKETRRRMKLRRDSCFHEWNVTEGGNFLFRVGCSQTTVKKDRHKIIKYKFLSA
jgi:hypothetical protein